MQGVKVKESKISGLGLFADQEFNEGDLIGIAHINGKPSQIIGKHHNHSEKPNAHSILLGNKRYIAALRPLRKGEEITVDYRRQPELEQPEEFVKGGSVSMPKAKYYAQGGESETELVPEMPTLNPVNEIRSAPTFNAAFKIARSTYGPNHIFEYQGRKYGTNLTGEDFKPSEDVLAQAGLNTPSVKENLNKQNINLNDPYASKSTVKLEPDAYKSWDEIKQKNLELNTSANADKIINYKNNTGGDRNYIIVDKKKGLMHVYEPGNNKPLFTSPVDLGATEGDAQTVTKIKDTNGDGKIDSKEAQVGAADFDKGNKSTGAGKYYISNIDPEGYGGLPLFNMMNESQYENFLKTGKVNNVATSIHKGFIPDDNSRVSNGCIRCNKTTLNNLTKYLENSSEVFILPEDPNNEFIIENNKLNFKVKNKSPYYTYKNNNKVYKKENGAWYIAPKMGEKFVKITQIDRIKELNKNATNASYNFYEDAKGNVQKGQGVNLGSTLNYVPIKAKLDKEKFVNDKFTYFDFNDDKELEVVNKFVSSLEQNKQKAMKAAKINGDVYNDIAQIAFGIFGTESNFADTHSAVGNLARATQKYFDPKGSSSPDYQSKYSTYGANEKSRSVGLTQIRWNYLSDDEKKALKSVGITSNADFMEPTKAALGTTVILGIRYNQQLTDKQKKDIWTTLPKTWNTRDNYTSRVLDNSKYLNLEQKVTNENSATKKDKWGRPATSKWYGFNSKTKKYEYENGGVTSQEEIDAGNTAMMKARLAYAQMHGNPAAQRMVVAPDQPYDFGDGNTGTHYMASMDNYAVPQIQDENGQLMLGDYGPGSAESIRFDSDEDANYFAENYKEITPDESYRQEEYKDGGNPGKGKKGKSKNIKPFVTSNPKEYAFRKAAYDDSLNLYKLNKDFRDVNNKFFFDEYKHYNKPSTKSAKAIVEEWKKVHAAADKFGSYERKSKVENKPSGSFKNIASGLSGGFANINVNAPGIKVLKKQGRRVLIESNSLGYQRPIQPVQFKKEEPIVTQQLDPTTDVVTTVKDPVYAELEQPMPTLRPTSVDPKLQKFSPDSRLQKFVEDEEDEEDEEDITDEFETDEDSMYATPDGGAEWVGKRERYIDLDGRSVAYKVPRFRKPGHYGPLYKGTKTKYFHLPSIESRYQAEIVPEEEYKDGGERKTRRKDSKLNRFIN